MYDNYRELLSEFISTESISTDTQYLASIEKTATWLEKTFKQNGFKTKKLTGYDNPIVLAFYETNPMYETCLIYGHYDVQPAQVADGWNSNPFEAIEKNGKIFGRGVVDNKGQVLLHMSAAFELIKHRKLGYNLIFMIEGNEETGSPLLEQCIRENKQYLKADFTLISDGEMDIDNPSLDAGFRGGFNLAITVKTSTTDLHSGLYGGVVPNAAQELANLIEKMVDVSTNEVLIPHFYDDVEKVNRQLLNNNHAIPFNEEHFKTIAGIKQLVKTNTYDVYTLIGLMPTIQVTGLKSGYTGEGYRNSVPAQASLKMNVRLVEKQKPNEIILLFENFVKQTLPNYCDYTFETSDSYEGIKIDFSNEFAKKAIGVMTKVYTKKPVLKFCGGSIPIVNNFHDILHIPSVLVPLGNEDCAMHAANENFRVNYIKKGLDFSYEFLLDFDR
jgi:acetylornithine deacetylase/succinyl-diaminopimelate desuccinylase-like protein